MEKMIRKYKILREIGKGGMGIVYKALDTTDQKTVAVKVLPTMLVDRSTVERFSREAQAMARLKHPNLIEVYDYGMAEGQHYFAMEFIEGESLKTLIKRKGTLSVNETLAIIAQAAEALAYTHGEGVIHRDIKSANIMVTNDGKVKVMDFGLVKIPGVTQVTMEGSAVGTAEYMSPEQVSDEELDTRTDMYSLGVTMYEMLVGHTPFQAENLQAVLMKHKYETPPPISKERPDIPAAMEHIAMKAMAKEISRRYQKMQELLEDIYRIKGKSQATQKINLPMTEKITPIKSDNKQKPQKNEIKKKKLVPAILGLIIVILAVFGFLQRAKILETCSNISDKVQALFQKDDHLLGKTEASFKELQEADDHHKLGLRYYKEGLFDQAIREYKKAINLRKDYGPYYKNLVKSYEAKKEYKNAIKAWEGLLKYDASGSYTELALQEIERLGKF